MVGSKIKRIEVFLPRQTVDNAFFEKQFSDWDAGKIEKKTGIRSRHIAAPDETALDMAFEAANKLLESMDPVAVDFLLLCTQSPDYYLPTGACILQHRLGLPTGTGAFDFNLGCSGFIYGLAVARGLISSGTASNIILVTSETYSKHIHPMDRGNRTIFGDAAAAVLISASKDNAIGEFVLGTDGSGYQNLIVPAGGLRKRFNPDPEIIEDPNGSRRTENNLYMNGPEIFNFTIDAVPDVTRRCLEKNGCSLDSIDYIIFHQANQYMLNHLRKKLGIPEEKFYIDMLEVGNTVSATIPIALKKSIDQQIVSPGDRVLLVGFGVGYSWGATVIRI